MSEIKDQTKGHIAEDSSVISMMKETNMAKPPVQIIAYQPQYAVYFERFNKAWIEAFYTLEPVDRYVLENPEEAILKKGGSILFASCEGHIIGAVALKPVEPGVFELTKMAVDQNFRGLGAGKLLCKSAVEEAIKLNAQKVILYSNTRQATAINIYRQLGFTEMPVEPGTYQRANIKMELPLKAYKAKYNDDNNVVRQSI